MLRRFIAALRTAVYATGKIKTLERRLSEMQNEIYRIQIAIAAYEPESAKVIACIRKAN